MHVLKRLLAVAGLLILAVTEVAPHRHADSLDLWLGDDVTGRAEHIVRCDGPAAGATHMHRDQVRDIDPCLACFRQHMRATASKTLIGPRQPLAHFAAVCARVAYARAVRLRKSSRGPPILPS